MPEEWCGGFGGELGVGEEAEDAEAVVHADDDDALRWARFWPSWRGSEVAAGGEAAAVDPDHDGKLAASGGLGGSPDVEGEAVFAGAGVVEDHVGEDVGWMQWAPKSWAGRTSFHLAAGCGGFQRRSPTGGGA